MNMYQPSQPNGAAILWMISGGGRSPWGGADFQVNEDGALRVSLDDNLELPTDLLILLDAGFTVFAVHHGSFPIFPIEDHLKDVRNAVRFVRLHSAEYGLHPNRIGVMGGSGGGLLSLLLGTGAMEPSSDSRDGVSSRPNAVVAYFAPTDIERHISARPSAQLPFYHELFPDSSAYPSLSPIHNVSSQTAPTLFVNGDVDLFVLPVEGETMSKLLESHQVATRFLLLPGAGHGFQGSDAEVAIEAARSWFQDHLVDQ